MRAGMEFLGLLGLLPAKSTVALAADLSVSSMQKDAGPWPVPRRSTQFLCGYLNKAGTPSSPRDLGLSSCVTFQRRKKTSFSPPSSKLCASLAPRRQTPSSESGLSITAVPLPILLILPTQMRHTAQHSRSCSPRQVNW